MEARTFSSKEEVVLDPKPLRSLAPMFPAPHGFNTKFTSFGTAPAVYVSSFGGPSFSGGGFPPGFPPLFATPEGTKSHPTPAANGSYYAVSPSTTTLINLEDEPQYTGQTTSGRKIKRPLKLSGYQVDDSETDSSTKRKSQMRKRSHKPAELAVIPSSLIDSRNSAEEILMTFDALRRRLLQLDEKKEASKRADLKAGAIMMSNDLRTNMVKQIGSVPGVEIGDIFYFRIEMCLVGLHVPVMGGIDYIVTRMGDVDDPVATSIVSSGSYDNEEADSDSLVYTGQGGGCSNKYDRKQMDDQKLERGNLALERSLQKGNLIRVVRSTKDMNVIGGKIYIYDGLYKIGESWVEKAKSGFNIFKYKMFKEPRQPEGIAVWKRTEKWKENPSSRGRVILLDISSGIENIPICLVNEVDSEKGPTHFMYATRMKYLKPINAMKPPQGCNCLSVCLSGDPNCLCAHKNGGNLPYTTTGFLVSRKHIVYECNNFCACPVNCRNRVTQKGLKLHFEVFRTTNRGWGLRCWDPIRAGSFIGEYIGEVISSKVDDYGEEDHYIFQGTYVDEKTLKWNHGPELLGEPSINKSQAFKPVPIIISAKNVGNVARFMNHSCSPNVLWQPVLHDHGEEEYPHIMFFAIKHIPPMTELTFDYGVSNDNWSWSLPVTRVNRKCLCGSTNCRGVFG